MTIGELRANGVLLCRLEANGGMENALPETFGQLDELLAVLGAK